MASLMVRGVDETDCRMLEVQEGCRLKCCTCFQVGFENGIWCQVEVVSKCARGRGREILCLVKSTPYIDRSDQQSNNQNKLGTFQDPQVRTIVLKFDAGPERFLAQSTRYVPMYPKNTLASERGAGGRPCIRGTVASICT